MIKTITSVGHKLLWIGLVFIIALVPMLKAFGLQASDTLVLVGAVLMVIGLVLFWFDR